MTGGRKQRNKSMGKQKELFWGWMFFLPTLAGLLVLNIIPIISTIRQSFYRSGAFGKGDRFIGLGNYEMLLADTQVWQAVFNTFKYAVIEVPFSIVIALVLAVLVNRKMNGRTIYRTIYFLPMVAAPAAVAMVWRWLYNSEFGLFNHILTAFGAAPVNWISNPDTAIIYVAIVGIWSVIGYNMVLFLAGIQEIPGDYYEAASIDGANGFRQFISITVPLISPTMFFVAITRMIAAFQVFDVIFMMIDKANPAIPKTQSLVYLFYKYSFVEGNKGYGSAVVVLLLLMIMVITMIQNMAQKRWVNDN